MDVVDQKNVGLWVLGQVSLRDVLLVAAEIGKRQGGFVEDADETGRPATMLDVGLTVGRGCGQKKLVCSPMNAARSSSISVRHPPRSSTRA